MALVHSRKAGPTKQKAGKRPFQNKHSFNHLGASSQPTIHDNSKSHKMADVLGADAFTVNNQIYFGKGKYRPNTEVGQRLIAHEIAHVNQNLPADMIRMSPSTAKGARQQILEEAAMSETQNPTDKILNIINSLDRDELELLISLLFPDLDNELVNSSGVLCHVVYIDIPQRLADYARLDSAFQQQSQNVFPYRIQSREASHCISKRTGNTPEEVKNALPLDPDEQREAAKRARQIRAELDKKNVQQAAEAQAAKEAKAEKNAKLAKQNQAAYCAVQLEKSQNAEPGSSDEQSYYRLVIDGTCAHPKDMTAGKKVFGDVSRCFGEDTVQVEDFRVEPEEGRWANGMKANLFFRFVIRKFELGVGELTLIFEGSTKLNIGKDPWTVTGPKGGGQYQKGKGVGAAGRLEGLANAQGELYEGDNVTVKGNLSAGVALLESAKRAFIVSGGINFAGEKWGGFGSLTYVAPRTIEGRGGLSYKIDNGLTVGGTLLGILVLKRAASAALMKKAGAITATAALASMSAGAAFRADVAQAMDEGTLQAGVGGLALLPLVAAAPAVLPALLAEGGGSALPWLVPAAGGIAAMVDEEE
jgi:hypothetical protein